MKNVLNYVRYVPKLTAVLIAGFLVMATTTLATAGVDTFIEGDIRVKNVTNNATVYTESTTATNNDVVRFKVWYHNTELPSSNKVAENLSVKIDFPTSASTAPEVGVTIKGDNTNQVYDSAIVYADSNAKLEYIPGSAKWQHNVGTRENIQYSFTNLDDSIVTDGAFVTLENQQPCFEYEAWVYFDAKIVKQEEPQPVYECSALDGLFVDRQTRKLSATAVAKDGATVTGYEFNFGDGHNQTVTTNALSATTDEHTYAPDSYTGSVKVNFDIDGDHQTDVSKSCQTPIEINEAPVYACTALTAVVDPSNMFSFTFKTKVNMSDDVSVNKYIYDFGVSGEDPLHSDKNTITKTYKDYGTYNANVRVIFSVGDEQKEDTCKTSVKIVKPETPPEKELPNTGPAGIIGGLLGTSALGMSVRSWLDSRSAVRGSILRKKED